MKRLMVVAIAAALCACSNPKNTVVPTSIDKMESIKPQLEKLSPEDRELFASYAVRHTVGAAMGGLFGIKAEPIPEGMTIGKAIDEQRDFLAKEKMKAAEENALKQKVEAARIAKQEEFAKLLTVALIAKKNSVGEFDQRRVNLDLAYNNKSDKDIQGVKGVLKIADIFGDKILNVSWSYDGGIASKQNTVERGSGVEINQFMDADKKLWNTDFDKLKSTFEVSTIIFKDGTRLDAPE